MHFVVHDPQVELAIALVLVTHFCLSLEISQMCWTCKTLNGKTDDPMMCDEDALTIDDHQTIRWRNCKKINSFDLQWLFRSMGPAIRRGSRQNQIHCLHYILASDTKLWNNPRWEHMEMVDPGHMKLERVNVMMEFKINGSCALSAFDRLFWECARCEQW